MRIRAFKINDAPSAKISNRSNAFLISLTYLNIVQEVDYLRDTTHVTLFLKSHIYVTF